MTRWKVVGGAGKGGIMVREGQSLATAAYKDRLSTDALVNELELTNDGRLHYRRLTGTGPEEGWVSTRLQDKELLVRMPAEAEKGQAQSSVKTAEAKSEQEQQPSKVAKGLGKLSPRERILAGGKQVLVSGLSSRPELNGKFGVVRNYDQKKERFEVSVATPGKDWPETIALKPCNLEFSEFQMKRDREAKGDEIVLVGEVNMRDSMYEKKIDAQYLYDQAVDRVLSAEHEYAVLDLPARFEEDNHVVRRQYRKISLAVHPDKNKHPQAGDAFRKVYGAFETLADALSQRKLLFKLGLMEGNFTADDEDELFEWWWEANISEIERAAAEAEGKEFDFIGEMWVSDGLGGDVADVGWISLDKARQLLEQDACIFIDCRDPMDFCAGYIPGAWNCPMEAFINHGVTKVLGETRVVELLSKTRRVQPVIIYSAVATPFSRCRALCRWMLRAGHKTLKPERLKRLKGGALGWKLRKHPVSAPLMDQPMPPERMPSNVDNAERGAIMKQYREAEKARADRLDAPWVEKPQSDADCVLA